MPQSSRTMPGWFVRVIDEVINEVVNCLERVVAYLDGVIVFDSDPSDHVLNIRAFFERLRLYNLKFLPSKEQIGATKAVSLGT